MWLPYTVALIAPGSPLIATAARIYLAARLVHYFVYAAGIPVIRTLSFFVAWGATITVSWALLT